MKRILAIVIPVLLVDQIIKIYIKLTMALEQTHIVTDWFKIVFVENDGAAWGMSLDGVWGKLALSLFRLVAIAGMAYYLRTLLKEKAHKGLISAIALVFAGAVGNMIDSAFYGLIFEQSTRYHVAGAFTEQGGYAGFLMGSVVDMLKFPLYEGVLPNWVPVWGGEYFTFFDPIFNIADMAISTGVGMILVFQRRFFPKDKDKNKTEQQPADAQPAQ